MSDFRLSEIKRGDHVRLRFMGTAGVPHKLGDSWATVTRNCYHATQWRSTNKIEVEAHSEDGYPRRVTIDEIGAVERHGQLIAERRPVPNILLGVVSDNMPFMRVENQEPS